MTSTMMTQSTDTTRLQGPWFSRNPFMDVSVNSTVRCGSPHAHRQKMFCTGLTFVHALLGRLGLPNDRSGVVGLTVEVADIK